MLQLLNDQDTWLAFYAYKLNGGHLSKRDAQNLKKFIDEKAYENAVEEILAGGSFDAPKKAQIGKAHSQKKRTVYIYPETQKNILKLLNYLLQQKYDYLFADNLFSFRSRRGARHAIGSILHHPNVKNMWGYKADISNYFNSIPIQKMLVILKETLMDEPETYRFIASLLENPNAIYRDELIMEEKGIMAGVPTASFLANLYLMQLDQLFCEKKIVYARYSDDIILFCEDEQTLLQNVAQLKEYLAEAGLCINPEKEERFAPNEAWTYLGLSYHSGKIDISPVSLDKIKAKIRRKTRALMRWKDKKGLEGMHAAKALIRIFNRKFFGSDDLEANELVWCRWFFPMINTDESLKIIDNYMQDCLRYLVTGKRTKARFNCRYEDLKALGYKSLVHEYYAYKKAE
ncbi:MAG: hypothetical protein J6D00_02290 [Christensenellaceae bacterium]|nr:hypothetical protein [Clostridia bacterium]MBP3940309.1 hypothetical protein [Christensenellaceae bacterium]